MTGARRRVRPSSGGEPSSVAPAGSSSTDYQPLSASAIELIHEASLTTLERTGIEVFDSEAREIFAAHGARIDADINRVFIPRSMVASALDLACRRFTLAARDPKHDLDIGGTKVYLGTGGAAVKVLDLDGEVRDSVLDDIVRIARLVDALDNIHFYLRPVVARDMPVDILDVNKTFASLANTTKHVMVSAYTVESAREVIELAQIVAGGAQELIERPLVSFTAGWTVSPLRYAPETVEVVLELIRQNMPVALSSAPQSGATAPASLAGTLVQINAEELSGVVLANLVRPGARILLGYVASVSDLRTGSFTGGAPEFALMAAACAQLAQFYKLPIYNSAALTDSKVPDIQAGYEKGMTTMAAALAGSNFVHHSAGFLESLMAVAYEQYVIDDDINGSVMRMVRGIEVTEETLAVDVINEVCGPSGAGHYLGTAQSLALMKSEYYYPHTGDRQGRDDWNEAGGKDMRERARARAREILDTHIPTPLPSDIETAIRNRFDIRC